MSAPCYTIVYADDDPDAVFFMQRAFERMPSPHRLVVATDGEEAIEKIRTTTPQLALLDLMMPFFNGIEVVAWMRCQPAPIHQIPAVLFSSSTLKSDIHFARSTGANGYIVKPAKLNDLQGVLHAITDDFLSREPRAAWHQFENAGTGRVPAA